MNDYRVDGEVLKQEIVTNRNVPVKMQDYFNEEASNSVNTREHAILRDASAGNSRIVPQTRSSSASMEKLISVDSEDAND